MRRALYDNISVKLRVRQTVVAPNGQSVGFVLIDGDSESARHSVLVYLIAESKAARGESCGARQRILGNFAGMESIAADFVFSHRQHKVTYHVRRVCGRKRPIVFKVKFGVKLRLGVETFNYIRIVCQKLGFDAVHRKLTHMISRIGNNVNNHGAVFGYTSRAGDEILDTYREFYPAVVAAGKHNLVPDYGKFPFRVNNLRFVHRRSEIEFLVSVRTSIPADEGITVLYGIVLHRRRIQLVAVGYVSHGRKALRPASSVKLPRHRINPSERNAHFKLFVRFERELCPCFVESLRLRLSVHRPHSYRVSRRGRRFKLYCFACSHFASAFYRFAV